MNHRANVLAPLRRWNRRAARQVVALFAVAYLSSGAAPCAASQAIGDAAVRGQVEGSHEGHVGHQPRAAAAYSQHDHQGHGAPAAHDTLPLPPEHGSHCPHCPAASDGAGQRAHASCAAFEDLTNVGAAQLKDVPPPLPPLPAPAAVTLPPPLASPRAAPQSRAARASSVPLNVRHCVFVI